MVPVSVPDVEMALDPGVVVERAREIAADRHPEGICPVSGGAEGPAEPGVGAVGDDHVAGPDRAGRRRCPCRGPSRPRPGRPRRAARSPRWPASRVAPAFTAPLGDHVVELAAPHHISVGREVGVLGPGQLEGDAVADRAQTVEPLELRELVGEAHVVELAHRPGREAVAARLLPGEALLVDHDDAVPERREPVRGRRARTVPRRRRARRTASSTIGSAGSLTSP